MPRWVLLLHRLPRTMSALGVAFQHHDWMIQPVAGAARLVTFRVPAESVASAAGVGPGLAGCVEFTARRLADHRAAYLEYEGEVSGGRGWVERVLAGEHRGMIDRADRFEVEMLAVGPAAASGRGWERWVGTREHGGPTDRELWRFGLQAD